MEITGEHGDEDDTWVWLGEQMEREAVSLWEEAQLCTRQVRGAEGCFAHGEIKRSSRQSKGTSRRQQEAREQAGHSLLAGAEGLEPQRPSLTQQVTSESGPVMGDGAIAQNSP